MSIRKSMRREHYLELKFIALRLKRIADQVYDICSTPASNTYNRILLKLLQEETEEKFQKFKRLEDLILKESGVNESEVDNLTELDHEIRFVHLYICVKLELRTLNKILETDVKCLFCESKTHDVSTCLGFENTSVCRRRRFLSENKLCFKCLEHHVDSICTKEVSCAKCGKNNHHSLVHRA